MNAFSMTVLSFFLLLSLSAQDPAQDVPEVFKDTPRGYTIQGGDQPVTTYTAVRTFLRMLENRIVILDERGDHRPLTLFASRFGVLEGTRAWDALMEAHSACKPILDRKLPTESAAAGAKVAPEQAQLDFNRRVVLDLKREYLILLAGLRDDGVDVEAFKRFIKEEVSRHVVVGSDVPIDDPAVQRMLAVERLFDNR
ncbi:MAG TPA: hypothetical protein VLU25_11575 [Acidobacteriota bacterium]|nr:hypothetical protein [Acidobacteriota bacterium]